MPAQMSICVPGSGCAAVAFFLFAFVATERGHFRVLKIVVNSGVWWSGTDRKQGSDGSKIVATELAICDSLFLKLCCILLMLPRRRRTGLHVHRWRRAERDLSLTRVAFAMQSCGCAARRDTDSQIEKQDFNCVDGGAAIFGR